MRSDLQVRTCQPPRNTLWGLTAGALFAAWYVIDGLPRLIGAGLGSVLGPMTPSVGRMDLWAGVERETLTATAALVALQLIAVRRSSQLTGRGRGALALVAAGVVLATAVSAAHTGRAAGMRLRDGSTDLGRLAAIARPACLYTTGGHVTATVIGDPLNTPGKTMTATAIIDGRLTRTPISSYSPTNCP